MTQLSSKHRHTVHIPADPPFELSAPPAPPLPPAPCKHHQRACIGPGHLSSIRPRAPDPDPVVRGSPNLGPYIFKFGAPNQLPAHLQPTSSPPSATPCRPPPLSSHLTLPSRSPLSSSQAIRKRALPSASGAPDSGETFSRQPPKPFKHVAADVNSTAADAAVVPPAASAAAAGAAQVEAEADIHDAPTTPNESAQNRINRISKHLIRENPRDLPILTECEVCIVGGGPAGLAAAIGARRAGADVVLLERFGCFGGCITTVGMETLAWYRYEGTTDSEGLGVEMERLAAQMVRGRLMR